MDLISKSTCTFLPIFKTEEKNDTQFSAVSLLQKSLQCDLDEESTSTDCLQKKYIYCIVNIFFFFILIRFTVFMPVLQ